MKKKNNNRRVYLKPPPQNEGSCRLDCSGTAHVHVFRDMNEQALHWDILPEAASGLATKRTNEEREGECVSEY